MDYAFGDTELAARRLQLLAEVFAEPTGSFLREAVTEKPKLVVDLGCGPGSTTHFLADILDAGRAVGLDNSQHFVALASKTETDRVSFYLHDVITVPFPVGPADLLFCRYLLTHMRGPAEVLSRWATQLDLGGLLLVEETEWIHTNCDAFATYIDIVEAMLAAHSNTLYVGPMLDGLKLADDLKKRTSDVRRFPVPAHRAAGLFLMNLRTWKHNSFVREKYSPAVIDRLQNDLKAFAERPDPRLEIEWGLRQISFERA